MPIQALLGKPVVVNFLISGGKVIAYSWHYSEEKSMNHLRSIMKYHSLSGELRRSPDLEEWLESNLRNVLIEGGSFELPDVMYRMREVYEELLKLRCGETMTYSELSRRTGVRYVDMLKTLMRNPFQVLIPCHRLLTKKGTLMGFYPLGVEVKRRLLELERRSCSHREP
ncbi:MAG: methylated-DNA--[protein]-cysteine S-methyltransferase [Candidatus Korarchaeota archaeon]|nr:methylated-DNA--[protein]-cysteine S-methyltransferase [Candidatus Korarchaeota archaeon]